MGEREGTSGNPLYDFHGLCALRREQVITKLKAGYSFRRGTDCRLKKCANTRSFD
jgi:hypothetical protein